MKFNTFLPALSLLVLSAISVLAQDRPVGYWRSHLPYNTGVAVATDGITAFVATKESFYTNNSATHEVTAYSKIDGMSDIDMSYLSYDVSTSTVILTYQNSNIDLFKEGSFFNLPDLKLKSIAGSKNINHIYTDNGLAYISTDIGIVVVNLDKKEIKETYTFLKNSQMIPVKGVAVNENDIFAATPKGIYKANKNSISLLDFSTWTSIDTTKNLISIAASEGKVFVTAIDSLFAIENNALKYVYSTDSAIRHIDAGINGIWISENYSTYHGAIKKMTPDYLFSDSFKTDGYPAQCVEVNSNKIWFADEFNGLRERSNKNPADIGTHQPEGPNSSNTYDIYVNNKDVWVAHGGYDEKWIPYGSGTGFSNFNSDKWKRFRQYEYRPFGDTLLNFSRILKAPDGTVYAGSYRDGLFVMKPDGSTELYRQNSILDDSYTARGYYLTTGLALDKNNNLWINMFGGEHELAVKTSEGEWFEFEVSTGRPIRNAASDLIIDDNNQKWWVSPLGGGVVVYDDNGTIPNMADDRYKVLFSGKGAGGLPNNEVYCIAKDNSNSLWIGTANGIGIISCPGSVLDGECESELRVVQYDDFAGYLFENEQVRAIAVDGANRKWIGTNNGIWLLSSDGDKIILRFTEQNSPLFSNRIQRITIDPVTGDVYIGTEKGMISYHGTATEGSVENKNVITYPNPIPSGYNGTIAIQGLTENADVRITDISGQLIHRTRAHGGQVVWNGVDYTGHRPQSGVYLIFITNSDGSEPHTGKMVFMQ